MVGYGGLIAYDDEAHVATLGVTTALQGEGIGSLLLDALLAEADKRSPVVLLEVRADNDGGAAAVRAARVHRDRPAARLLPAQRRRRRRDAAQARAGAGRLGGRRA